MHVKEHDQYVIKLILDNLCYEPHLTFHIERLISPGMTVIDIGANVGYYTLLSARLAGPSGKVYAFEPDPDCYEHLLRNIRINRYRNVVAIAKAVWSHSGNATPYRDSTLGNSSLADANRLEPNGSVETATISLDDFMSQIEEDARTIDFIKIDAQGSEGHILAGSEKLLSKQKPMLAMEFCPSGLRNLGTDPKHLLDRILDFGYDLSLIEADGSLRKLSAQELIYHCETRPDVHFADVLFT